MRTDALLARASVSGPLAAHPLPASERPTLPYIHVRHTKTAGWQVVYHAENGRNIILRRRQASADAARRSGEAAAWVHDCRLEVDP